MILAQQYLARHTSPFAAYMALQRALMEHYLLQGGTAEMWCARIAPAFRRRYAPVFSAIVRAALR